MAFDKIIYFKICSVKKNTYLCSPKTKPKRNNGVIAQLVEQRTENPCVPGSIPGDTTKITKSESKKSCSNATLFFHLASMLWQSYGAIVPVFVGNKRKPPLCIKLKD